MSERPVPSPHRLWQQAQAEHPDDWEARRVAYIALMIEHGHLIVKPERIQNRVREGGEQHG